MRENKEKLLQGKKHEEIPIDEFLDEKINFRKEFLRRQKKLKEIKLINLIEEKYSDILNKTILNKDTNRRIKVASALTYDKYSHAYRLAKAIIDKNKKMPEDESSAVIKKLKDKFADNKITNEEYTYLYTIEDENKEMGNDVENNKKNAMKIFKFSSETDLQKLFGDGEILNIKVSLKKRGDITKWPKYKYNKKQRKWIVVGYEKREQPFNSPATRWI